MPSKGQIIEDKFTKNVYEFVETAEDTKGEFVKFKMTLKDKGKIAPAHIHILQDEIFEVVSGKMTYFLNGEEHVVQAGESVTLPKNIPHNHYNNHDEPLVMYQTVKPAYDIDYFVENLVGLANDGKVKNGDMGLLQALVTVKYLDSPSLLADIPTGIQKVLANVIAPIARMFGYRALYKRYTGLDK